MQEMCSGRGPRLAAGVPHRQIFGIGGNYRQMGLIGQLDWGGQWCRATTARTTGNVKWWLSPTISDSRWTIAVAFELCRKTEELRRRRRFEGLPSITSNTHSRRARPKGVSGGQRTRLPSSAAINYPATHFP